MNNMFGARLGSKHHSPDIARDLQTLCNAMRAHRVFELRPGRTITGSEVPNVATIGLQQLGDPLKVYNAAFTQLQRRRRGIPLADMPIPLASHPSMPESDSPAPGTVSDRTVCNVHP